VKTTQRSSRLETFAFVTVALMSAVTGGAIVYNTFFRSESAPPNPARPPEAFVHVPEWKELLDKGILIGDPSAPVQIVEFADLECPFCGQFHAVFDDVTQEREDIALTFVHYPLSKHRFARPAAHAAECALEQGRFRQFVSLIYQQQDSLGLKNWGTFASQAGIADTIAFGGCFASPDRLKRIDAGLDAGASIGVSGTPTVIINGWRVTRPPYTRDSFEQAIEEVLRRGTQGAT
jgi:protein-disulfide isomerase